MSIGVVKWGKVSDLKFLGESAVTLDGKGRITVPVRHRETLSKAGVDKLIVTKHKSGCLLMMPLAVWEVLEAKLMAMPYEAESFARMYLGSAAEVEIDSGSRVLLPPELRRWARLERDVTVVGMGRRMEIWAAEVHAQMDEAEMAAPNPEPAKGMVF